MNAAPHCIVEIRWGKLAGTKAVIAPGSSLRVGHGERTQLAVPHDTQMSNLHFELSWDGKICALRDLESKLGTQLGGLSVKDGVVPHGGWIRAGITDFMVYVEGKTPPNEEDDEELSPGELILRNERREKTKMVHEVLQGIAAEAPLYAVLDAARSMRILQLLRESVETHRSLYEGVDGEPLEDVAPYLVGPLRPNSRLLERLAAEGWGHRWGIYCTSREPFREVRRHFRRFLMAEIESTQEPVYFRFYDPDVLRAFAEVWTSLQKRQFLELLGNVWVENESGLAALVSR